MNCPSAVADIVLEILRHGILRARGLSWSGNAAQAAREADHIHNLPDLLKDFAPEKLQFYWEVSRPSYIAQCGSSGANVQDLAPLWERLRACVEDQTESLLAQ